MDALSSKDNANNVYKNNVNKWGTFGGIRLDGQEEKKVSLVQQRVHFWQGPLIFQLTNVVMYIACTT